MKDIKADNSMELFSILKSIDITAPPRNEGRTTEHCETWSICRLLATLTRYDKLTFPIQLINRERPDFLLVAGGCHIGIELTDAVNQDYAKATTLPEANREGSIIDSDLFKRNSPTRDIQELRSIASEKKLTGPGWEGIDAEREYAEIIFDVINRKTKKFLKSGFEKFQKNWLAVYCDLGLPDLNVEDANQFFVEASINYWEKDGFNAVFVEKRENTILYSRDTPEVMQIESL